MHEVGASWLMTSLSSDPRVNALVSAAGSLPMFFLALPAGALADILDRRKLLVAMQFWAFTVTGTLAVLTYYQLTGPLVLLVFTSLLAIGGALSSPAWQSITPELVKRSQLSAAIGLGGVSFNIARVIGPTLGGAIIGFLAPTLGNRGAPAAVFALNAVSFLGVVGVIYAWKREPNDSDLPPEHVAGAIKTGLSYARHAPEIREALVRVFAFIFFGSALWALLPLHARFNLKLDATGYGTLLGFFGAGALCVGATFQRLRERFSPGQLVALSSWGAALNFGLLARVHDPFWARLAMIEAGFSWPLAMLTFQVVIIKNAPDWVRSRAASLFLLVFTGGMAGGAGFWGLVSARSDIPTAFCVAAGGLFLGPILLHRFQITESNAKNSPSNHWPDPILAFEPTPEEGPILVTTEFEIAPDDAKEFVAAMQKVRQMRLREGVLRWNLFQDMEFPSRWVETMLVGTWNDHLRQHARVSQQSADVEFQAWEWHRGSEKPRVSHLLAARARRFEDEDNDADS